MTPAVSQIIRRTLPHFGLEGHEPDYLLAKDRHQSIATARNVAIWVARYALRLSFPELGRVFGNRDHTTIMNSVRRIDRMLAERPDFWISVAARHLLAEIQNERAPDPSRRATGAQNIDVGPGIARAIEIDGFEPTAVGAE